MSTENQNGAAPAAPSAPVQPAANNANPPAPPVGLPDPDKEPEVVPKWLASRLERERKNAAKESEEKTRAKLLAELGIEDPEAVKKLIASEKKRAEDAKSQEQKLAELQTREQQREAELKAYRESTRVLAEEQLATLTEAQRKVVQDLVGDDPAKLLKTIATLRPTWEKAPSESQQAQTNANANAATEGQQAAPPVVAPPKPASATGPAASAPPPAGGTTVVPNHYETYRSLSDPGSSNYAPFFAAAYRFRFAREIAEAEKLRGA